MSHFEAWRSVGAWLRGGVLVGALGLLAAGCAGAEAEPTREPASPVGEPREDKAPPLGAPRPKLLPGEAFKAEED